MKSPLHRRADTVFARLLLIIIAGIACTHLLITTLMAISQNAPAPAPAASRPPSSARPAPPPAGFDPGPPPPPDVDPFFGRGFPDGPPPPPPRQPPSPPGARALAGPEPGPPVLGIIALECLMLALAAWVGARLLSRPIRSLAQAATRIGEDLDAPALPESGPREAREAAAA